MAMKIILVDDQPVPGLTLRRWLRKERELQVVGEAVPGSPALALIQLTEPDVVVLDLLTSPEAGLDMVRQIREVYPDLPIVAIGEAAAAAVRAEAAQAGAWAFFPKSKPEELPAAIRSVIEGNGRRFVDLTDRISERPTADSFAAGPAPAPRAPEPIPPRVPEAPPPRVPEAPPPRAPVPHHPKAPQPAPEPSLAVVLKRAPKAQPPRPNGARKVVVSPPAAAQPPPELRPPAPVPAKGDAVAWVSPSLESVSSFELARPKPRKPRRKKDQAAAEADVRGPTGLPRRSGRHR